MAGLDAATRLVSRRLVVGRSRAARKGVGGHMGKMTDGSHHPIVQIGLNDTHVGTQSPPEFPGTIDGEGRRPRRWANQAPPSREQIGAGRARTEMLRSNQGVTGHEVDGSR
jgi:hypothetical protein